jgi:hypothetical protein
MIDFNFCALLLILLLAENDDDGDWPPRIRRIIIIIRWWFFLFFSLYVSLSRLSTSQEASGFLILFNFFFDGQARRRADRQPI